MVSPAEIFIRENGGFLRSFVKNGKTARSEAERAERSFFEKMLYRLAFNTARMSARLSTL